MRRMREMTRRTGRRIGRRRFEFAGQVVGVDGVNLLSTLE